MKKADYKEIAKTYDISRSIAEETLDLWLAIILEKIGSRQKIEILDLGCGTGRFSIPMAILLGFSVTGADKSEEMLMKARKKDGADCVKWDIQDAMSLSYPNASFNAVFMSHLLHHVEDPLKVVEDCYRILKAGGVILNRYGSIEDISDDPEHRFFPETIGIDKTRTPTVEQVEKWFRAAGFNDVSSETISQNTYSSAEDRLKKAELKSTSVLTLISEFAFEKGIEKFRKYISKNPNDPWLVKDKMTITVGKKKDKCFSGW